MKTNYYQQQVAQIKESHLLDDYKYILIRQSKAFMDENYMLSINLDEIASSASFSKYHFIQVFKRAYGKSPYLFHNTEH